MGHGGASACLRWASPRVFSLFENLIQAVNILGSLFYGTILGIFLVAFFVRHVQGTAVFVAALVAQAAILVMHFTGVRGRLPLVQPDRAGDRGRAGDRCCRRVLPRRLA